MGYESFRFLSAQLDLREETPGLYTILNVFSRIQRRGDATGLMWQVVEWADQRGYILQLEARQYANGLSNSQLEAFYVKFDFEALPDPVGHINMIRFPSQELQRT